MKASVVIPVYNMAQYVGECIASVLRQTLADFEVIVVDDASTDNTLEVVKGFAKDTRVRLVCSAVNGGVSSAINCGARYATGDYICALGSDDLLMPWMLEKQSAYLDEHPDVAAVFGLPVPMNEDATPIEGADRFTVPANRSRAEWFATLMAGNCLMGQTCLYRRSLHNEIGWWDEKLAASNDIDWFIRIVKEHDIYVQHIPMACIRKRNSDKTQLSSDSQSNRAGFFSDMEYIRDKHKAIPQIGYNGRLIIATPMQQGNAPRRFINSLLASARCLEKLGVEWDWIGFDAGADRDREKNAVCAQFLEGDATDLLFIDASLEWNPLGLLRLLMNENEIVGGSHLAGESWSALPMVKNGIPQGVMAGDNPLLKAETLSSTFLRIKKSALQKYRDAYPDLRYGDKRAGMADDYQCTAFFEHSRNESGDESFCGNMRALGVSLWIEPQIEFKTIHTQSITKSLDQFYRDLKEQQTQLKAA